MELPPTASLALLGLRLQGKQFGALLGLRSATGNHPANALATLKGHKKKTNGECSAPVEPLTEQLTVSAGPFASPLVDNALCEFPCFRNCRPSARGFDFHVIRRSFHHLAKPSFSDVVTTPLQSAGEAFPKFKLSDKYRFVLPSPLDFDRAVGSLWFATFQHC